VANPARRSFGAPVLWFLVICLILVGQAVASRRLDVTERDLPVPQLHSLPSSIGGWHADGEQTLPPAEASALKPDEYIMRDYATDDGASPVNLFVAYFKSVQNAYGPHSPRICLPGSGWLVRSSKIRTLTLKGQSKGFPVKEYVMEKGPNRIFVLYWYQNNRNIWAEEYWEKFRLLPDLLRYRRSDVSLVRLITPLSGPTSEKELAHCLNFTNQAFPLLTERLASVN
jgi:EpsI family protein